MVTIADGESCYLLFYNIIFFIAKAGKRVYNNNNKVVGGK